MSIEIKDKFKDINGLLSEPNHKLRGKYFRFCAQCGYQMRAEAKILEDHCKSQHGDQHHGFLKFGKMPPNPVYTNFEEYLRGDADNLILDPSCH